MNSTPGSPAAAAGGRGRATLRPSQVSFNRLFVVGYLQVGDILSITIENITHPFTISARRQATWTNPYGLTLSCSVTSGPFSILVAAGLAGNGHVNRGVWDNFVVYRHGHRVGTLNQIRRQFWDDSEAERLRHSRQLAGFSV